MTLWHRYGEAFRRRALRLLHWSCVERVLVFESHDRLCFDQGRPAVVDTPRGEERTLTPLDSGWRRGFRPVLGGWNARRVAFHS